MVPILEILGRSTLLSVFLLAALSKIHTRAAWQQFQRSTHQLSGSRLRIIPPLVVGAEMATVPMLLFASTATAGLALCLLLLVTFSAGIAQAIRRGNSIACRCFGSSRPLGPLSLVRNSVLIGLTVACAAMNAPYVAPPDLSLPLRTLALTTGWAIAAVMAFAEDLAAVLKKGTL